MSIFRDRQVRLAMLLLYGLAALCLSLAHAERIFAEPLVDRPSFCLSEVEPDEAGGLPECGPCKDLSVTAPLHLSPYAVAVSQPGDELRFVSIINTDLALQLPPVGSRAPPLFS